MMQTRSSWKRPAAVLGAIVLSGAAGSCFQSIFDRNRLINRTYECVKSNTSIFENNLSTLSPAMQQNIKQIGPDKALGASCALDALRKLDPRLNFAPH